jgi:hypothetical protein
VRPGAIRIHDEVRVEEAGIVGDFLRHPCRSLEHLGFCVEFDFSDDQACVLAQKLIDLPRKALVVDAVPDFFDDVTVAGFQKLPGVNNRDRVFELDSSGRGSSQAAPIRRLLGFSRNKSGISPTYQFA